MSCCNKMVMPTPKQMLNGVKGLAKVATKTDLATDAVVKARRDICRECEFATRSEELKSNPSKGLTSYSQCLKCACVIKYKTMLQSEACPLSKWGKVE